MDKFCLHIYNRAIIDRVKHIKTNLMAYVPYEEKVQGAWIDLQLAVDRCDLKMATKYVMYLRWLEKSKEKFLPVIS